MKKLLKILRLQYTSWIPLGSYNFAGIDHITFVKRNLATGMLKFKTKIVNVNSEHDTSCYKIIPENLINTKEVWDKITSEHENSSKI